ncbi:MAG: response regulator [Desulfovibrio sp.]|uniref:response regulator n=1 Tax=Desulfovibrio sp. 7SRBS1 TaxID=3378064 RepID=UPI003B411281
MDDAFLQKIMMVEDDADIQIVGRMALEKVGGFTVKVCSSGVEALQSVGDFAPDLILLDVMMPEMDGPATLQELRAQESTKSIPVIFMTAKAMPQEVRSYKKLGALDVIPKPFDPMQLSDSIRSIWDAYRQEVSSS